MHSCLCFYNEVVRFASQDAISKYIRLHFFYQSKTLLEKLTASPWLRNGITYLCADTKDRLSYDLSTAECETLNRERVLIKNQRKYIPTDIRIEKFRGDINPYLHNSTIVVFTHEWALYNTIQNRNIKEWLYDSFQNLRNRKRLKSTIKLLAKNNFNFIS